MNQRFRLLSIQSGLSLALTLVWTSLATAQFDGFQDLTGLKPNSSPGKAEFTATLGPADAKAGDIVTLSIKAQLPKGFYIYATTDSTPTSITTKENGLEAVDAAFVPDRNPEKGFEPLLKKEYLKFDDHVTWTKRYRILKGVDPATVLVNGELTGQYCTNGTDEVNGQCTPIIPPFEFHAKLGNPAKASPVVFESQEWPKLRNGKPGPASLTFKLSPENAKPGEAVTFSISMELDKGWHTFSLTQKGDGGSPTEIEVVAMTGLKPKGDFQPDHPPEIEKPLPDLSLEVHNEKVTWSRTLEVLPGTEPGAYGISGQITYQTCETKCLAPRTVSFELGHVASADKVAGEPASDVPAPPAAGAAPQKPGEAPIAKHGQSQGLFGFVLTAIGFGLVSLLTPCVFPMVPITVSFFLKQSESEHHQPLAIALTFCASIVLTFTVLGVGIAAIFGASQLNALANNPWLNVVIGLVFVVFACNMLGLFEIRIPSSLLTFTANKEQAGGYVGAIFMALTFTLTSFTCTFAFAGTLLVAAAQGQYYWPIIGMLSFGAAFASPFFILALVPSLVRKLPKSGGWMNAVKVVMGMIEVGAAIKFFSVADLVWNPQPVLFDFTFVMICWLVLSLTIALYLIGILRLSHDIPPNGISVGRMMLVVAFLGLSLHLAIGIFAAQPGGGWIMQQILAFAPPKFENDQAIEKGGVPTDLPEPVLAHHGIWFTLDVDKAISHAQKQGRPLLFDFTGVNCTNCRLMELKMAQPNIRTRLDKFVLVQLYADKVPSILDRAEVERLLKRNIGLQVEWFGDVSLPSYAVVTSDGKTILSKYEGLERKEGEFATFLDDGFKRWEGLQPNRPAVEVVRAVPATH